VELARLVRQVREIEAALGAFREGPSPAELRNRPIARRSLVAARPIPRGERFSNANLEIKRPGGGLAPIMYWELIGREATRDYAVDEAIDP
jgi:sialic acid synthase SpsE